MFFTSLYSKLQLKSLYRWALLHSSMQFLLQLVLEILIIQFYNKDVLKYKNSNENLDAALGQALNVNFFLFMITSLVQLGFLMGTIYTQNSIHLVGLFFLNLLLVGESVLQYHQTSLYFQQYIPTAIFPSSLTIFHTCLIALACIFCVTSTLFSWFLHKEFGWTLYKAWGADLSIQAQRAHYFIMNMLTDFGCYFYAIFFIQLFTLGGVVAESFSDMLWNGFMALWTLLLMSVCCKVALAKESRFWMLVFLLLALGAAVYLFYTAIRIFQNETCPVRQMPLVSNIVCIFFNTFASIQAVNCVCHFGFGYARNMKPSHSPVSFNTLPASVYLTSSATLCATDETARCASYTNSDRGGLDHIQVEVDIKGVARRE